MVTASLEYPHVLLTGVPEIKRRPSWISEEFSPEVVSASKLEHLAKLSQLTVVRAHGIRSVLESETFLEHLSDRFRATPRPAKVVFVLDARSRTTNPKSLRRVLAFFDRADDVEFACGVTQAGFALSEAVAKIWEDQITTQRDVTESDPLKTTKSVIAATKDLRSGSSRLAADRIAEVFELSLNALASAIDSTRQALFKTPDSEAIQTKLFPFERIARLRSVLPPEDFRAWLNMSNELLDGNSPIQVIKKGKAAIVADLADDMLTGNPT